MIFKVQVSEEEIKEIIKARFAKFDIGKPFEVTVELGSKYYNISAEVTLEDTPPLVEAPSGMFQCSTCYAREL